MWVDGRILIRYQFELTNFMESPEMVASKNGSWSHTPETNTKRSVVNEPFEHWTVLNLFSKRNLILKPLACNSTQFCGPVPPLNVASLLALLAWWIFRVAKAIWTLVFRVSVLLLLTPRPFKMSCNFTFCERENVWMVKTNRLSLLIFGFFLAAKLTFWTIEILNKH